MSSRVRFESAPPVRVTRSFKGQSNFAGLWWMATTRSHVSFESWLKRDHLIVLDFDPSVVGVSSCPFLLRWRTDDGDRHHAPDYFARRADGTAVVIDVRTELREPDDEFAFIAAAGAQVGWEYRQVSRIDAVLMANLRWLAGYRHPRCGHGVHADALREAFAVSRPLADGIAEIGDPLAVRPTLFHLMWSGALLADLRAGVLSHDTVVTIAPDQSS